MKQLTTQEATSLDFVEEQSLFQSRLYAMSLKDAINCYERLKQEEIKTAALLTAEVLINKLVAEVKELSQIEISQRATERRNS